jgi:hypothetical protein
MHCLVGVIVSLKPPIIMDQTYFPIKISVNSYKARKLLFKSEEKQKKWFELIKFASGFETFDDHYKLDGDGYLESGNYG